jgi:hypothetical protein
LMRVNRSKPSSTMLSTRWKGLQIESIEKTKSKREIIE